MKRYLKLGFAAAALMFVFNIFAATEVKAQGGILNEILKRMDEHQKALTSLKANVMREVFNAQLNERDVYEGAALYRPAKGRDALVRIDWVKPVEESLAVVNKTFVIYRPRLKQAITGNAGGRGDSSSPLSFMSMSKEQLRANYNVKYLGQENISGGIQTWHLELTPKTAQKYKLAELWVDGNGMPLQAKIVENNNDSQTILLSNLQKNISIDGSQFQIKLPKDVKPTKA